MNKFNPFPLYNPFAPAYMQSPILSGSPSVVLPGTLVANPKSVPSGRSSAGFSGRPFIYQNASFCGSETYLSSSTKVAANPAVWGSTDFEENMTMDYALEDSPPRVYIKVTGDVNGEPGGLATSATQKTYEGTNLSGNRVTLGSQTKSSPVTVSYLGGKVDSYLAKPKESFRDKVNGGGIAAAGTSASGSGYGANVFGVKIRERGYLGTDRDATVDGKKVVLVQGYKKPFKAEVSLVTRANAPRVRDLQTGTTSSGLGVFTKGVSRWLLGGRIGVKKWRDALGTYARGGTSTFIDMGYARGFDRIIPQNPSGYYDVTGMASFLSADGGEYRIKVEAGRLDSGGRVEFVSKKSHTINVPADGSGTLFYGAYAKWMEGVNSVRITRVQVKKENGGYETIEIPFGGKDAYGTLVSDSPYSGVRVLAVVQRREGQRWGHLGYNYQDHEDKDKESRYATLSRSISMDASSKSYPGSNGTTCGSSITGSFRLTASHNYDTKTGAPLPKKGSVSASCGGDFSPENYLDYFNLDWIGSSFSDSSVVSDFEDDPWTTHCTVSMDEPMPNGKIVSSGKTSLIVPNTQSKNEDGSTVTDYGPEYNVPRASSGKATFPQQVVFLP